MRTVSYTHLDVYKRQPFGVSQVMVTSVKAGVLRENLVKAGVLLRENYNLK